MKRHSVILPDAEETGFLFGSFRLEPDGTLLRRDAVIHLPPKELEALRLLLARAGQIVTPLEMKKALWGEVHVTADSVTRCVSSLRAKLQPDDCIQTVYKRGYRLMAQARHLEETPPASSPRLAILPFATGFNVASYLGPAVAEETLARLTGERALPVTMLARDSVFTLAEHGLTARQIGKALNADLVLTGTLRSMPLHYRLRVEMIRVEDDAQIWVEDFLVPESRIAGLESELVERLVYRIGEGGLFLSASGAQSAADEYDPTRREAFAMFQRGHQEWQTLQRHRMQEALLRMMQAAKLDPTLIAAQVDLVNICVTQAFYGFMAPSAAAEQVRRTAAAIPDSLKDKAAILPALGWIRFHVDHDLPGALQAFAASAHLPHDPWTTRSRVMFSLSRHRFAEAIGLLKAVLHVDPYSPWMNARLGWALHLAGQAAESRQQAELTLNRFPGHEGANLYGAMILAYGGDAERAVRLAEELQKRSSYFDVATAVYGYTLAKAGRRLEALAILEQLQWLSHERFVLRSFTPALCVAVDDLETAIGELKRAELDRCPWFFQMLADPRLDPLHRHPEFIRMQGMLARMEAEAEQSVENPEPASLDFLQGTLRAC